MASAHHFGIRHHGPGCARSLVRAFDALRPDCVLVEGPPEADALVAFVGAEGMVPPVALLSHCPDEPQLAVHHPFAEFSPEWQALRWATAHGVPARFIDLPRAVDLALHKARCNDASGRATPADAGPEVDSDAGTEAGTDADVGAGDGVDADADVGVGVGVGVGADPDRAAAEAGAASSVDPLDWLARAAGHGDGESWWNHLVEERGDGEELFAAIEEAMVVLRGDVGDGGDGGGGDGVALSGLGRDARREALREAHMRQCVRRALREGFERVAVVCGAWHVPGLKDAAATARADAALLRDLPRVKVAATWVPWSHRHLLRDSGYGAGIRSPGWYEHLWRCGADDAPGTPPGSARAVGWLARVARLLRERDLDCSSAHLIEAARLADGLAALRERPTPGLDELREATRAVLTLGDDALLRGIDDELVVGDRLGSVPPDVPTVPLQRDLQAQQKALRLKPEPQPRTLDLDLRQPTDLARSHLLHRLGLLDLPWGKLARTGRSARGSFHEVWTLQWQPEFALQLIDASRWGNTVAQAASARTIERCAAAGSLEGLSSLVNRALLADLAPAVAAATRALDDRAAVTGDTLQLLGALPPLANVLRYGNVRRTDGALVARVLDALIVRAAIGLPLAAQAIDDAAAGALRDKVLAAHGAVALRDAAEQTRAWQRALEAVATHDGAHALVAGLGVRLLLDAGRWAGEAAARAMSLHLSAGAEPARAAAWLDGFVNRNATVLLHDAAVWGLLDDWLAGLGDEHFVRVLPLVRRTFSAFGPGERRDLAQRAVRGAVAAAAPAAAADWDERRAALALPLLRRMMGIAP